MKVLEYDIKELTSKITHVYYDVDQVRFNINIEDLINNHKSFKYPKDKELLAFISFSIANGRININDASLHIRLTKGSHFNKRCGEMIIPVTLSAHEKIEILNLMY